ncbi:MAG: hypothetical protein AAGI12_00515 [Pseudomonadota bacterium]
MERIVWILSELGPLLWFVPTAFFLTFAAWRGGTLATSIALGCLLTGTVMVLAPDILSALNLTALTALIGQVVFALVSILIVRMVLPRILSAEI